MKYQLVPNLDYPKSDSSILEQARLHQATQVVRPIGIWETRRRSLDKLVMSTEGDQEKVVCSKLQLCAGLDAGIEGDRYVVW